MNFLYLIGTVNGPVKVGVTTNLRSRLMSLQTGCHFRLDIFGLWPFQTAEQAKWHERAFHDENQDQRLKGEWFSMDAFAAVDHIVGNLDVANHIRIANEHPLRWGHS